MSETSMWLFPVIMGAAVGLVFTYRNGLRWSWGLFLQQLMILFVSGLGLAFLYAPKVVPVAVNGDVAASYCAWASWSMFLVFNIGQRLIVNRLSHDLYSLRLQEAQSMLWMVRLLAWGPPAGFWSAMTNALSLYYSGKVEEADALIDKWQSDPWTPWQAKESLLGLAMNGRVLRNDWDGIIDEFDKYQGSFQHGRTYLPYLLAGRAFAEKGRYPESLACLELTNASSARLSTTNIDINFLTYFALFGADKQLQFVSDKCTDKRAVPTYARLLWLAKCQSVRGETQKAIELLREAKEKTPANLVLVRERIDRLLNVQLEIASGDRQLNARPAPPELIAQADMMFHRWRTAADIVRPSVAKPGLIVTMILLVVAYIVSNPDEFLRYLVSPETRIWLLAFQRACLLTGQLDGHLWTGEWWRAITYMFLHGNTAHLLLNVGALYLFGKSVENIYGTGKFFVIFFGAGVLSGLAQLTLTPGDPAIGASGAILGVFGAAIAGIVKLKNILPKHIRQTELRWMISVAVAQVVFDQVVNNIAAMTDTTHQGVRIAAFAHCGGIIAGFIIAMLLPTRRFERSAAVDTSENSG